MGLAAWKAKSSPNEVVRQATAGCLSHMMVEVGFHMIDTVNISSKANPHIGTAGMFKAISKIYAKDGLIGFGRGFSAAFYGSFLAGSVYFGTYKVSKQKLSEIYGESWDISAIAFLASTVSEVTCLVLLYPFDLVKCRL